METVYQFWTIHARWNPYQQQYFPYRLGRYPDFCAAELHLKLIILVPICLYAFHRVFQRVRIAYDRTSIGNGGAESKARSTLTDNLPADSLCQANSIERGLWHSDLRQLLFFFPAVIIVTFWIWQRICNFSPVFFVHRSISTEVGNFEISKKFILLFEILRIFLIFSKTKDPWQQKRNHNYFYVVYNRKNVTCSR